MEGFFQYFVSNRGASGVAGAWGGTPQLIVLVGMLLGFGETDPFGSLLELGIRQRFLETE